MGSIILYTYNMPFSLTYQEFVLLHRFTGVFVLHLYDLVMHVCKVYGVLILYIVVVVHGNKLFSFSSLGVSNDAGFTYP
ncbi:hypothetical protein RND71_005214 [Anisodus tanguticus]|uniref:Uncharacterized protein n=1 Tax=Anisodus tanguticus TaxID=243964 RepID=A0AAE1SSG0_9SOLA|nr:hypothetical protein RND71_005214 [Anisodus tanguticus]